MSNPQSSLAASETSVESLQLLEIMVPSIQQRIVLGSRPKGDIDPDLQKGTFRLEASAPIFPTGQSALKENQVLIKNEWLSLDPAMRGWLNDSRSYLPPVQIGEVMRSGGVGTVVAVGPGVTKVAKGDWVSGQVGWQEYAVMTAKEVVKINIGNLSPSVYLGALGMPAQTAYWGMLDVAKVKAGEVVVVSGAAGAVGSVACQIAKIKGCRVIAIAGGPQKCQWLRDELGVDATLDYKSPTFVKDFKKTVGYFDVYFDNVGGEILDLALSRMKQGARIALCGAISAYNDPSPTGLKMYLNLISMRASITGFIVFDYASRFTIAEKDLLEWIGQGKIKIRETKLEGLESCPRGLIGLFKGENTGKLVIKINHGSAESKL